MTELREAAERRVEDKIAAKEEQQFVKKAAAEKEAAAWFDWPATLRTHHFWMPQDPIVISLLDRLDCPRRENFSASNREEPLQYRSK